MSIARLLAYTTKELVVSRVSLVFTQWVQRVRQFDFEVLEIADAHLRTLSQLFLVKDYRDPFDRLLIAQALIENLTLVSRDGKFGAYAEAGLKLAWQ